VKFILSVSPALTITEVVLTVQVLATLDGPAVVDAPHDSVAMKMGNSRYWRTAGLDAVKITKR
jgi:hypothetical protein